MSTIQPRIPTNYEIKKLAFPYQSQAVAALRNLEYGAIFHEQGLGKTKIAIDLLIYWLQNRDIDTVLIVTKKQLIKNWQDEFKIHTHITPKILSAKHEDNFYTFNSAARVIITNFETISSEKDRIKLFLKTRNVGIIIDESAKLKNPDAKITQDFFEISDLFKAKIIMTGTPVANRPYDIWAQIYFLDNGKSLGENFKEFKANTDLSNKLPVDQEARNSFETETSRIFEKISSFAIRETKASSGIQLPEKTVLTHTTEFSKQQSNIYYKAISDLTIEIKQNGSTIIDDDSEILKRLLRLNQITSNPRLLDETYTEISGKEKILDQLLNQIVSNKEKCIVWSNFIENIEYYYKKYKCYNPAKIHGKMTIDDRNSSVQKFKTDDTCKILFATPQSAKEGLTLTIANHAIFYDRGFNLDDYLQAQDRIHRISQKKNCYIHNIMINNSIDEWINILLNAKHNAALLAQGDIELSEYKTRIDYSYGEIMQEIIAMGEQE